MAKTKQAFTTGEVAEWVGVNYKTIHGAADAGKILGWKTPGNHWRFEPEAVATYLRELGREIPEALAPLLPVPHAASEAACPERPRVAHDIFEAGVAGALMASEGPSEGLERLASPVPAEEPSGVEEATGGEGV